MNRSTALVLLLSMLLGGCLSYAPAGDAPRRASRVRVTLVSPADFRLTEFTANEVVTAEGEMVRMDEEEVVLSAVELRARSGYEFVGRGETLTIPRSNVARIETQRVSVARSALLAGVVVLVMTLAERVIGLGTGGGDGDGGGPPVQT
ncbi:MAG TPA: hypothetical protein VHG51_12675 [Longimicrobiaceae bacterium]|nr:hypothetical protein [Longimicrobiaceae bacterium]